MVSIIALENCPKETIIFSIIGKAVVFLALYALVALFINQIILAIYGKKFKDLDDDNRTLVVLGTIFWPLAIVFGLIYWLVEALALPFTAARRRELRESEERLSERIEARCPPVPEPVTKFKVGQLITGIRGNPDNYNHLNEGCVCRVKEIDEAGRMKVVLVDHKDFAGHTEVIGKVFKAPARNFVKYKKSTARANKATKKR